MDKYKVIALSVGGVSNKIFKSGDEVSDTDFPEGAAKELVKKGFLKPMTDKEIAESKAKEAAEKKAAEEAKAKSSPKGK